MKEAGRLSQDLLQKRLRKQGYNNTERNPTLFRHKSRQVSFILATDDFYIKYFIDADLDHLHLTTLQKDYLTKIDLTGQHFIGFHIDYDPTRSHQDREAILSMPGSVDSILKILNVTSTKQRNSPSLAPQTGFVPGQQFDEPDHSPPATAEEKKFIQRVVGMLLYHSRGVCYAISTDVGKLSQEQAEPTKRSVKRAHAILQYLYWHRTHLIRFTPQKMQLNFHSDASFLSESKSRSRAGGIFWIGQDIIENNISNIDGIILVDTCVINNVCTSVAHAEYSACFKNSMTALRYIAFLEDLGYPQDTVKGYVDNACAVGLANRTCKDKQLKHMNMRLHKIRELVDDKILSVHWCKSSDNIADFPTKNFTTKIFQEKSRRLNYHPKG